MKILTYKDLILGFIKQNLENKEHQKQVRQILSNENSVFLYSQKFFAFIKESIEADELDTFQNLLKQFSDCSQNIKSSSNSQNFDEMMRYYIYFQQHSRIMSGVWASVHIFSHKNIYFLSPCSVVCDLAHTPVGTTQLSLIRQMYYF